MTREEAIKDLQSYADASWGALNETFEMAIAALREQPHWISVEERLPEPFVSVLVHMPEERPLPTVHEGYVTNSGKWYAHFFEREPFEVTHWMPLPEPPEVEV